VQARHKQLASYEKNWKGAPLMPLKFHTQPQQMIFVDHTNHSVRSPADLLGNTTYDVFIVLQNDDPVEYTDVQVFITHSAFGINLPGGTSGLSQPAPVIVPPAAYGLPGLATIEFQFTTPPGGHGCLLATLQPSGPTLQQNINAIGVPIGISSMLSFLVYGGRRQSALVCNSPNG
jgi:hypothetical protein